MQKYIKSEKGGTLMIAFGFIVVLAIMIAPLVLQTNNGLLQAKTGGNKEIAFTQAHSAYSVFGRLYENLQTKTNKKYTKEDVEAIYNSVANLAEFKSGPGKVVLKWEEKEGKAIAVIFTSQSGEGNQKRVSKLKYPLKALPEIPEVTSPPTKPEPTKPPIPGHKTVIQNNPVNDRIFVKCPVPSTDFIDHSYNPVKFRADFGQQSEHYLTTVFQQTNASRLEDVATINNNKTALTDKVINGSSKVGAYAGNINIIGTSSDVTLIDGIEAAGNLVFAENISKKTTVNGKTRVGGNLTILNVQTAIGSAVYTPNEQLTFSDSVYVRGDAIIGSGGPVNKLIVKGDLIIGGNLTFKNTAYDLQVEGDLIIGGDLIGEQASTIENWTVNRSMLIKGSMKFNNTIEKFAVGGNFISKKTMEFSNRVKDLQIGGALVSGNDMKFGNNLDVIVVGTDLIADKNFTIAVAGTKKLVVNGNFIVYENASISEVAIANTDNKMNAFMVGGTTKFINYTNEKAVCITG